MIKYILAGVLIVGASVVNGQERSDSTRQNNATKNQQPSNQFNTSDYMEMESSDMPYSLRSTLQEDTYKGWEQGTLYRRKNGEGYWLKRETGNNIQNYYFDKDGKAIQRGAIGSDRSDKSGAGVGPGTGNEADKEKSDGTREEKPKQ